MGTGVVGRWSLGARLRGRRTRFHASAGCGALARLLRGSGVIITCDAAPDQLGLKVLVAVRRNVREELLDHLEAEFRVRHLPAAELQRDLDLHVLAKESDRMLQFHAEVVGVDLRAQLDLFDLGGVLVLPGFLIAFGLLVAELAIIHQPANGRRGVGGDLHQIHAVGARKGQGFPEGQDAKLFAIGPDHPDFAGADFPVNPDERTGRRRIT